MSRVDALVGDNLPLVRAVAARAFPDRREDDDLLQCGRIALWQAARRWDGQRPFAPYACSCIHNAMRRFLKDQADPPRLPPPDRADDCWDDRLLDDLCLRQRIAAAWPPGSLEHYVLTCLAAGVPKQRLAAALGRPTWALTRLARRAWSRVPL